MTGDQNPGGSRPPSRAVRRLLAEYRVSGADLVDDAALVEIAQHSVRVRRQVIAAVVTVLVLVVGVVLMIASHLLVGGALTVAAFGAGLVNLWVTTMDHLGDRR